MAEILPSFVQRTIPGSSYEKIVRSSENNEINFGRSNEQTENNTYKYPSKSSSKKVPTENDEVEVGTAIADRKNDGVPITEEEVTERTEEISQGMAFPATTELGDEDEDLGRDNGPITVYAHAVDKPSVKLESCNESDLVEEFQRLDLKQTEIADKKPLNVRGPTQGVRIHGSMETSEFSGKFMRPSSPDVTMQYRQYVDPMPAWGGGFSFPPLPYHPNPLSNHVVFHPTPPPLDVLLPYPYYHDPNPPSHPNIDTGSVVNGPVVVAKSTSGHTGPPGIPVFGSVNGTQQASGYTASDELDLVSEYVKDQMRLEEDAKRMKQVSPKNFKFPFNSDAAAAAATTATATATATAIAVSNAASVGNYGSDIARRTGNSPCDPCTSPNSEIIHIPSTVDEVDFRGSSPGSGGINPASRLNPGAAFRPSGSSSSLLSPHQTATPPRSDASPRSNEERHQVWTRGPRCDSLSPSGSQISENSGENTLDIGYGRLRSTGPNSVGSLDSIHSSPMSAVETESSGDESFEERQSKMAEAERKAESYEKETLISPDSNGDMALHLAMIDDDWYLAEAIINRLVRLNLVKHVINVPNKLQQTPLCLAVIFNKSGIVEKLVENGADVNVHIKTCHEKLGPKFCQPLHLAASRGGAWKKTLRQLMRAENIDLDAFNSDGKSALHCAIESHGKKHNDQLLDCKEILRLLAENGANLNQPDCGHEKTPLHYAIERRDVGLVTRLLCLATSFQSPRCERSGVSQMLEAKTGNGNTALHLAASVEMNTPEHKKMIQQLMCKGADPSVKNSDGFLPRELTKNREIVELLKGRMVTGRSPYSDRKRTA